MLAVATAVYGLVNESTHAVTAVLLLLARVKRRAKTVKRGALMH